MLAQAHIVGSAQTRAIMERQLAPATTTLYETYLRKFRRWLLQHSSETKDLVTENSIDGARLEAVHVSDFMSEEFDLEHTSAGTYSTCISAVKALLRAQEVPIGSLFRGNWALGVLSRYLFSEKAGDCYAGRILAGLPVNSAAFPTNCPDFVSGFDEQLLMLFFLDMRNIPQRGLCCEDAWRASCTTDSFS